MVPPIDRRQFLRGAGAVVAAAAAGGLASACGSGDDGKVDAADAGSAGSTSFRKLKLGFIALTDCAPLVMAKELGFYERRGLDVELIKQASWPATRDNLLSGQIDGAHCLSTMPFSVASGVSGSGTALKIAMILNNNGQAITLSKDLAGAGYGDLAAAKRLLDSREPTLAMTYPGGTHDLWLRYWLRATGADQSRVKIIPIPPAQMVQNMKVGNMDGFCVGEPWNAVAAAQDIGFTHITTQDIWEHHPEKALVVNERTAGEKPLMLELIGATLEACRWLDDLDNRAEAAATIGAPNYVNAPADEIRGRLLGSYELGADLGSKEFGGRQMMFSRGGATNAPRRSYGYWTLAQYQRLGLVGSAPDYSSIVDSIVLRDLYAEAAEKEKVEVPDDDMSPFEVLLDGTEFDPSRVDEEARRP
ncbi:MAG TPA: CmpA/NrtA family ABC transporter substrate-binding protein [Acidimicrobiales bacterium]|nr:CmpA/NrtA family ABC transporter substrate-binding protein [Acidimicrobiales bacterium]